MKYIFTILIIFFTKSFTTVEAHGYLASPKSRNQMAREANIFFCPHCLNGGTVNTVQANDPDGKWNHIETIQSSKRHGLCGDAINDDQHFMIGGDYYTGEIQNTYQSGQEVEFTVHINTHHHGYFEFFVCDRNDLANPETDKITQKCLLKHQLLRSPNDPSESPYDSNYPGRYYLDPKCSKKFNANGQGFVSMKYLIPENLECEHCVLQWWWVTANSCSGPGYDDVNFPNTYANCNGDGGAKGWLPREKSNCYEYGGYPEEFWNCADIKIEKNDGSTKSPTKPTKTPTIAPTKTDDISTNNPTPLVECKEMLDTSEDCSESPLCCGGGRKCYKKNQWWASCRDSCIPGETDDFDNLPWECTILTGNEEDEDDDGDNSECLMPDGIDINAPAVDNTGFTDYHGKLTLNGVQLSNQYGEAVQLQGISSHGLQWFPDCYKKQSIQYLVENHGINVFRAAMYIGEGGYATNPNVKVLLEDIVDWCEKLGIYVVIDWHVLKVDANPNYWLDSEGATTGFAIDFWKEIATKYKDKTHVLYEIANEPNNTPWNTILKYHNAVISIIREIDPETIILAGTPTWSQDIHEAAKKPVNQPYNVMYSFHFYAGTHIGLKSRVLQYADKIPIFCTEWGTSEASGNNGPYLKNAKAFLDVFSGEQTGIKISHIVWSYADKAETSALLMPGACNKKDWGSTSCSGKFITAFIRQHVEVSPDGSTSKPTVSEACTMDNMDGFLSTINKDKKLKKAHKIKKLKVIKPLCNNETFWVWTTKKCKVKNEEGDNVNGYFVIRNIKNNNGKYKLQKQCVISQTDKHYYYTSA